MRATVGKNAAVIGAGVAGLSTAAAIAPFFERVTILERDALTDKAVARAGTPQSSQLHVLLGGGSAVLTKLFANFETCLTEAGAVRVRTGLAIRTERPGFDPFPQRDLGWDTYCLSRPLLETLIRDCVAQIGNIEVQSHSRVVALLSSHERGVVKGVRCEGPLGGGRQYDLVSDLVIDASSRGNVSLAFLQEHDFPLPEETEIGIRLAYATATFSDIHPNDWRALIHRPVPRDGNRGAFIFPMENGLWQVALNGYHNDAPPKDWREFKSFAKSLRTATCYDAIEGTRPTSGIHRFIFPSSRRRHFEKLSRFPDGLIILGDAHCRLNPVYGQGMSLALLGSNVLARIIESRVGASNTLQNLGLQYYAESQELVGTAWASCETDFVYPATTGRAPAELSNRLRYSSALAQISAVDIEVQRRLARVAHLLDPASMLREKGLADRVEAVLSKGPAPA